MDFVQNQPLKMPGMTPSMEPPAMELPVFEPDILQSPAAFKPAPDFIDLSIAALKGAALGPFQQIREIGSEFGQAYRDHKTISELVHNQTDLVPTEIPASRSDTIVQEPGIIDRLSFFALKAWYAGPMVGYQVADDALTYPLYIRLQEELGTKPGYAITAAATLALAAGTGYVQRAVEKKKAALMHVDTVEDHSEFVPPLLDATVNSSLWQVVRKANEPREEDEPVRLVGHGRIAAYAGAYAVVNTGLYAIAEKLPSNEWAGFGVMLGAAWMIGGAYKSVKEQLQTPELPS